MDQIIHATGAGGFLKMSVISARDTVERARQIHDLSPTACAALGRTLCGASLLGESMKEENAALTIRIQGGGPIGTVLAVSDSQGYVRRDIGLKEPYVGSTELVSGEIAEDLTAYLLESEQVPSACALGVLVDTDRSIKAAGGFLVQLMPGAEESLISTLEENIFLMDQLTTVLSEDGAEALFGQVLKGLEYHIVGSSPVGYRCDCSRERVEEAISCIDRSELEEMIAEDKEISVSCQFCDRRYAFTPVDLKALLERKAAGSEKD